MRRCQRQSVWHCLDSHLAETPTSNQNRLQDVGPKLAQRLIPYHDGDGLEGLLSTANTICKLFDLRKGVPDLAQAERQRQQNYDAGYDVQLLIIGEEFPRTSDCQLIDPSCITWTFLRRGLGASLLAFPPFKLTATYSLQSATSNRILIDSFSDSTIPVSSGFRVSGPPFAAFAGRNTIPGDILLVLTLRDERRGFVIRRGSGGVYNVIGRAVVADGCELGHLHGISPLILGSNIVRKPNSVAPTITAASRSPRRAALFAEVPSVIMLTFHAVLLAVDVLEKRLCR